MFIYAEKVHGYKQGVNKVICIDKTRFKKI